MKLLVVSPLAIKLLVYLLHGFVQELHDCIVILFSLSVSEDDLAVGKIVVVQGFDDVHSPYNLFELFVDIGGVSERILGCKIVDDSVLQVIINHLHFLSTQVVLLAEPDNVLEDVFGAVDLRLFETHLFL